MREASAKEAIIDEIRQARREVSREEVESYRSDGFIVLRRLLAPEAATVLREEVLAIMEVVGLGRTKLRQTPQYLLGSALEAYVQSNLLSDIASRLMGRPAHLYLPFTAVKSGGGGGRFHFHQDGNYTRYVEGQGINLWMALSPTSEANGALQMLPRSHLKGELASQNAGDGDGHRKIAYEPDDFLVLEMEPSDVAVFGRWMVHGSGPNNTADHRVAYAVQFHSDNAVAEVEGERRLLAEKPRFKDIWGVAQINPDQAGKRDGH